MSSAARAEWVYQGAEAGRDPKLTANQRAYAITLRRQLAERLTAEAGIEAKTVRRDCGVAARYWAMIEQACRREARRMDRALNRLSRQAGNGHG